MSKFNLRKKIDSVLKPKGIGVVSIEFLGVGGAFDHKEGNASCLLKTKDGSLFLVDCGHTAYSSLKEKGLVGEVDRVFITHCHEDHISSLSTFIYDRFFIHNKKTVIECTPEVCESIKQYLKITGHLPEMYDINCDNHVFIEQEFCEISITKLDTSDYHWPYEGFPNSGLLFHVSTGDDYFVIIYSGDINTPIMELMDQESYPFVYEDKSKVFVFHDMTVHDYENNPHCNFSKLEPFVREFNIITYHHNSKQVSEINKVSSLMASTSIILYDDPSFVIEKTFGE